MYTCHLRIGILKFRYLLQGSFLQVTYEIIRYFRDGLPHSQKKASGRINKLIYRLIKRSLRTPQPGCFSGPEIIFVYKRPVALR